MTSQWHREVQKTKELIERMLQQSEDRVTEDNLEAIAEKGVSYIVYSSLTEPGNEAKIIRELGDPMHGTRFA